MAENIVEQVKAGYAFDGPVVEVGALVGDGGTATAEAKVRIPVGMFNRHGLVAGATGTGKTKTLQVLAEQLSAQGVPVFLADIKGDLSGMAAPGVSNDKITARASEVGQDWQPTGYGCEFYALGGKGKGVPIRATITSFGPTLLSKVLGLNEVQESSLGLIFHFADSNGLPLLDLKDLRAVIQYLVSDEGKAELEALGGLSKQTAGVLLRELVGFAATGADAFFGEPEFDTADLLRVGSDGRGIVSVLELPGVQQSPALFSTFLMWLVADLFHDLPEVGDPDKPKLVFFLDEAHLLFKDASKAFLDAITQTVRLIRSKGVGLFFVTQTPKDVPGDVLAQLGNRVQHALRAYTPDDAKALKATVSTFPHSSYDLEELLTTMGIGEAVVTVLSDRGVPTPVAWTRLQAPTSLMGPLEASALDAAVAGSSVLSKYAEAIDRESAYEKLSAKVQPPAPAGAREAPAGEAPAGGAPPAKAQPKPKPAKEDDSMVEKVLKSPAAKSFARSAASAAGRAIMRSIFGTARR
ncbi:MAG: helicase HerA-like domain-containing protein [Micromonosporaceae bacterium]